MQPDTWPPDKPLAIVHREERRDTVLAVNAAAAAEGIVPGLSLAHARAVYPRLAALPAQPAEDAKALHRLAGWCLRYSPLVAPVHSDSIWIDATGVAHLFGGEARMLAAIRATLRTHGLTARLAIAATPGAAWALSHFGDDLTIATDAGPLESLPLTSLRLNIDVARGLWRVGVKTVADLRRIPRPTLPLRFGSDVLLRLDQATGRVPEAIDAVLPPLAKQRRLAFAEPIAVPEDLKRAVELLTTQLCEDFERTQEGARTLDLLFHRTDGHTETIRIDLARAARDPAHFAKLLGSKIETVDPGLGIEAAVLRAWRVEPLFPQQITCDGGMSEDSRDLSILVDALVNQVGARNVYRIAAAASHIPERAEKPANPVAPSSAAWPVHLPRPVRLFAPPEPVDVTALLPDYPPARFLWRGEMHKIARADGPERVFGEWWNDPKEVAEARDYFRIEDEKGERFWLFRDSRLTADNTYRWYLHGVFA